MNIAYETYRDEVLAACVALMGAEHREFFEHCTFEEEFAAGTAPVEVALAQYEELL